MAEHQTLIEKAKKGLDDGEKYQKKMLQKGDKKDKIMLQKVFKDYNRTFEQIKQVKAKIEDEGDLETRDKKLVKTFDDYIRRYDMLKAFEQNPNAVME